jgi:hypothetical protein
MRLKDSKNSRPGLRENDRLKRIVAEKELQITIMEEARDLKNPR